VADAVEDWMERNHFVIRRVHSLLGVFPIGVFLIEHLLTNSLAFWPHKFDEQVHWLHNLHYLFWLEVFFIFIPIAIHAVYGVVIVLQAKNNAHLYPYLDNWRFALQRWTGVITIIFIVTHLLQSRRKMSVVAGGLGVLLLIWGFMSLGKLQFGESPTGAAVEPPAHAAAVAAPQPFELSSEDR
jgi:succinate dehydrogenase/fumarate reductase cytochrome b subunit